MVARIFDSREDLLLADVVSGFLLPDDLALVGRPSFEDLETRGGLMSRPDLNCFTFVCVGQRQCAAPLLHKDYFLAAPGLPAAAGFLAGGNACSGGISLPSLST
jgi:hypothetical protein